MDSRILCFFFAFSILCICRCEGQGLAIDFSFNGDANSPIQGAVAGQMTGGFEDGVFNPTDVVITAAPLTLSLDTPLDFASIPGFATPTGSYFDVKDGVVTAGHIIATTNTVGLVLDITVEYGPPVSPKIFNAFTDPGIVVSNTDGFAGVSYSVVSVPEPCSYELALIAAGVLFFVIKSDCFRGRRAQVAC